MVVVIPARGISAAAFAAGLLLAGCSSDSDVPPTVTSAPGGGTQLNTDTGSGGQFPDVNTTPTQRPTSTIQDLAQAPDGLAAAQGGGTQYGEALVGGPTSTAEPPPPPPPPEPPQEALAPIPEPGVQTQTSDAAPAEAPTTSEQAETPPAPQPEPEPVAEPDAEPQGEGQTIQGTTGQAEPEAQPEPEPAPVASAPEPVQPAAPTYAEPEAVEPSQPAPVVAPQPSPAYGSNQAAQAPEAYGVSTPQPNAAPAQNYNSTQVAAAPGPAPSQGQPRYGGEPVGLIYFRDGSSELSSDDLRVIQQIAEIQRAYGGVVSVIGHASVGGTGADQQANQRISEARATAVAEELMRFGVPLEAIRAGAAGDSQPLYSEAATNGAAGNRRVEVYLSAY
jgi:outer membrane protein OmpA-like peptidoglycan-associated protein